MTHVPPALLHDHLPLMSTSSLPFLYFHTPFSVRIRFSLKLNALKESSSFLLEAQQGFFNRLQASGTSQHPSPPSQAVLSICMKP
jgi:hypothetical protein